MSEDRSLRFLVKPGDHSLKKPDLFHLFNEPYSNTLPRDKTTLTWSRLAIRMTEQRTILTAKLASLLGFEDGVDDVLEHLLSIESKEVRKSVGL